MTSTPLASHWESDHHGAPSCHWKQWWSIGDFVPHCWEEIVYCRCDGNCAGSSISDQNWIKNRKAAASRVTEPRLYWQMNQRMNEHQSLLFCSLPVCPFLILSFQEVCFWEKILQHDLACCLSIPCYLSSFEVLGWKAQTEFYIIFCVWISFPINAKKNLLQHLFFAKHTYLLELHLELNSGSSFHLYRSSSRVDVPSSGPENVPKPGLLPFESPLSAVSSTCKEIMWDKCYGSVRLALTASLTKKCVVWNCALSKWMQMAMSSQWDKCHKIDVEFKQKQLLYIWSLVGPTPEGTPL